MIQASYSDKRIIVDILSSSFDDNKSINYVVRQGRRRDKRIRILMSYSFEICYRFGRVFLSDDRKGCALILLPEKKKTTLYSSYLDLVLLISCVGLANMRKALDRESKIKQLQLKETVYYVWFIGVYPSEQHQGTGTGLLNDLLQDAESLRRTIILETSSTKNIPWYEKFGFFIYNELNLGYRLFFLKK